MADRPNGSPAGRSGGYLPEFRTAHEIKGHLDGRVIGQDQAKEQLSVALSMHLGWFGTQDRAHKPPNIVAIGPTGVGKTHTIREASQFLGIPFVVLDATSLVPAGIVGAQVEDALDELVRDAARLLIAQEAVDFDGQQLELARRGVIYIDEFDKLAAPSDDATEPNALKRTVQRRLLKLVEGSVMATRVPGRSYDTQPALRSIDTSGILMIAGGSFDGIDSVGIRRQRSERMRRALGDPTSAISADLVAYGLIPELVARFPVLVRYEQLDAQAIEGILRTADVTPVQVWFDHFTRLGRSLEIGDDVYKEVARQVVALNMGARGINQVLFPVLADVTFEAETATPKPFVLDLEEWKRRRDKIARRDATQ